MGNLSHSIGGTPKFSTALMDHQYSSVTFVYKLIQAKLNEKFHHSKEGSVSSDGSCFWTLP